VDLASSVNNASKLEACVKPILKNAHSDYSHNNSDTDESSDRSEIECKMNGKGRMSRRRLSSKGTVFIDSSDKDFEAISSLRYPNKKYLVELLVERKKKRNNIFNLSS
jgi:hypothetical protein